MAAGPTQWCRGCSAAVVGACASSTRRINAANRETGDSLLVILVRFFLFLFILGDG